MGIRSYRDLELWQKAMDWVVECHRITKKFPKSKPYLSIAYGSLAELETHI